MMNLEKNSIVKRKDLDDNNYFNSLLKEGYKLGSIDLKDISDFEIKTLELLKLKSEEYNKFSSSSIEEENAKMIMESNIYTIGLYLKTLIPDDAILILKNENFLTLYNFGRKILNKKVYICKTLYREVLKNKMDINNETYNSTIIGGIKGFFKIYNPNFDATNIKITADYPLYNNLIGVKCGIEFIEEYLKSIYYENKFCNKFSSDKIKYLLYGYSHDYEELIINIFQIVFTNVIGCIIANENIDKLTITENGLFYIYDVFEGKSREYIDGRVDEAYLLLKDSILEGDNKLLEYIEKGITKVKLEIYNGVELHTLDKVFMVQKFI